MPYRIPKVLDYPFDCTKCKHFKKPLLKDSEAIRYLCMKGIYMPKWSSLYVSCKFCSCLDFEPTPESGLSSPKKNEQGLEGYIQLSKRNGTLISYTKKVMPKSINRTTKNDTKKKKSFINKKGK